MSKALKRLKGRERSTIDNLAHCLVLSDLARNIEGLEGVFDHYLNNASSTDQRRQWQALQDRVNEIRSLMCDHIENDGRSD